MTHEIAERWRSIMSQEYEQVYTVYDYYDGPRHGVADFYGSPHVYLSKWDADKENWSDTFLLQPVDQENLSLILEDWGIWDRWNEAFKEGLTKIDTHPAMPEDKSRHNELALLIKAAMTIVEAQAIEAHGEFIVKDQEWWVRWLNAATPSDSKSL